VTLGPASSFREQRDALIRRVRERLRSGPVLRGCFVAFADERLVDVWAAGGLDLVVIDLEHSALDPHRTDAILAASVRAGIAPLVRVAASDRQLALRALDSGAVGIMVADTRVVEVAREWRTALDYPPHGTRGVSSTRSNDWGLPALAVDGVEPPLLAPMIETAEAVARVDELLATGVADWWHVGRTDLTHDVAGRADAPAAADAIAAVYRAAERAGVALGDNAGPAAAAPVAGARVLLATDRQLAHFGAAAFAGRHD
jgi:4-hydroxy-2-oxoheptanedioate aldolase